MPDNTCKGIMYFLVLFNLIQCVDVLQESCKDERAIQKPCWWCSKGGS